MRRKSMKITFEDMNNLNVPKYCRKIMKEDNYPKTLEIYRGEMLCLTVDVEGMSGLRLVENEKEGPVYRKYRPSSFITEARGCTVESLMRLNDEVVGKCHE
jgi:hypothetical protein